MNNNGLIGYTGFIGSLCRSMFTFNKIYNRSNLADIAQTEFDLLICAAPTGSRLAVQNDPTNDLDNILTLISHIKETKSKHFILISTIDVLAKSDSAYGSNRKFLEDWVKSNLENYSILRLPTLIHPDIKKNILYDLKHSQWLEKLNPTTTVQYYDLTNLKTDIEYAITHDLKESNLFSEPIQNQEIVDRFFPNTILGAVALPAQAYNFYPQQFTKEEIFRSMEKYFNEVPLHLW